MTAEEWKKELSERAEGIVVGFAELKAHLDKMEALDLDEDAIDELGAYMIIKLTKMRVKVESICGGTP